MNSPLQPVILHAHMIDPEEFLDVHPDSSMILSSDDSHDTAFSISSDEEFPETRRRIKKRRSICKAMSDSLKIGHSRDISSSNEDISDESMPIRRRLRMKPKNDQQQDAGEKSSHSGYTTCSSLTQYRYSESDASRRSENSSRPPSRSDNRENGNDGRKRKRDSSTGSDSESSQKRPHGAKRARKGNSSSSSSSSSDGEHRHRARRRTHSTCPECKSNNQPAKTTFRETSKTSRHMSCETSHSSRHIKCSNCKRSIEEIQSFVRVTMNREGEPNDAVRREEKAFLKENMGKHRANTKRVEESLN